MPIIYLSAVKSEPTAEKSGVPANQTGTPAKTKVPPESGKGANYGKEK
jgi:hypothetical protein